MSNAELKQHLKADHRDLNFVSEECDSIFSLLKPTLSTWASTSLPLQTKIMRKQSR